MDGADLAARVELIERRLALYDLLATYGPAVDSGSADAAASLWSEGGTYDFGDQTLCGPDAIGSMVRGRHHQELIQKGAAHLIGFPKVEIEGDRASVTGYSQVCRYREGHFEVWRVSANRWELTWDGSRWMVESRAAYPLDGRDAARALLGAAVAGTWRSPPTTPEI